MLIKDVSKKIQDDLNGIAIAQGYPDVVFNITDNIQKYESDKTNADGDKYTPSVLTIVGAPFKFEDLDIEVRNYSLQIYGFASDRHKVEEIINQYREISNTATTVGTQKVFIYKTTLFIDEFLSSQDGRNTRRFNGRVNIEVQMLPYTFDGTSIGIKVDGTSTPFKVIQYRKDKSVIQNVPYGNNNRDIKMVSDTIVIEFPLTLNTKIQELFSDLHDSNYNKKYTLEMTFGSIVKTIDVIFRVGNLTALFNSNPLSFTITFEIALPRKNVLIDGVSFPIMRRNYTGEMTPISYPVNEDGRYIMKSSHSRFAKSLNLIVILPEYEEQTISVTLVGLISSGTMSPRSNVLMINDIIPEGDGNWVSAKISTNGAAPIEVKLYKRADGFRAVAPDYPFDFRVDLTIGEGDPPVSSNIMETMPFGNLEFIIPKTVGISIARSLVDEAKEGLQNRSFTITEYKYGKNYVSDMILQRGSYNDAENSDLFIDCNFIDSDGGV